jgi:hypothetical protein
LRPETIYKLTLQRLLDDAGEAFSADESSVHDAEERFQRVAANRTR